MEKSDAKKQASEESKRRGDRSLKKINQEAKELANLFLHKKVRILFQDEAGFGRINKPKYCRCTKEVRPLVPCHPIREYRYVYGAVEPLTGENFFLVLPHCNTENRNVFMEELSKEYKEDLLLPACDGAGWHKLTKLKIPENIRITHIPPYTPEMNPIEQIWKQLRSMGFNNEVFKTLEHVVDRLYATINARTKEKIKRITHRDWIGLVT